MQETKTNALGIRITDAELQRLEVIKSEFGLPSMTNTSLGHDLLVMGMEAMERRTKTEEEKSEERKVRPSQEGKATRAKRSSK